MRTATADHPSTQKCSRRSSVRGRRMSSGSVRRSGWRTAPADLQAPDATSRLVPDRDLGGDEVGGEARAGQLRRGRRDVHGVVAEESTFELFVEALGGGQEAGGALRPPGVAAGDRKRGQRAGAGGQAAGQEGAAVDPEALGGVAGNQEAAHDSSPGESPFGGVGGAGGAGGGGGGRTSTGMTGTSAAGAARRFTNGRALRASGDLVSS